MEADEDSIVNEAIDFSSNSKSCSQFSVANPVLLRAGEKKKKSEWGHLIHVIVRKFNLSLLMIPNEFTVFLLIDTPN